MPVVSGKRGGVPVRIRHVGVQGGRKDVRSLPAPRDTARGSLKCEPPLAEQLREAHQAIRPGYHLNKRHWNTVTLDGSLSDQMIADLIEDSYDLVVSKLPRARRRGLAWRGDAG